MTKPLILHRQDAVAIVSINDAPYNRMTLEFIDTLEELEQSVVLLGLESGSSG